MCGGLNHCESSRKGEVLRGEQLQGPKKAPAAGIQGAGLPASRSLRASEPRSGSRPQQSPRRSTWPSFLSPPDSSSWQSVLGVSSREE